MTILRIFPEKVVKMTTDNSNPVWARRIGKFLVGRTDANDGQWTIKERPVRWALMDFSPDDNTSGIALIIGFKQYSLFWPRSNK
jgi:hypothetical protein